MKKVKNISKTKSQVINIYDHEAEVESYYYKNKSIILDFSFAGAFASVKSNGINSYMQDEKEFAERFKNILHDIRYLSTNTANVLFNSDGFRHCHVVESKNENKIRDIIRNIFKDLDIKDNEFEQELGEETFYQLGLHSEIRFFGTVHANVFKVYFIDYYHELNYDQRRNTRNVKNCNFCIVKS